VRAAIVKTPKENLQIENRPVPVPGPGETLLRVHACGVCRGDLMIRDGEFPFARYPIVPGHEVAGVVESLGPGVTYPARGTRVGAPWLYSACGHCPNCLSGDEVLCKDGLYTGVTRDGGYQEFMLARADYVLPLPNSLGFADAAPLRCAQASRFTRASTAPAAAPATKLPSSASAGSEKWLSSSPAPWADALLLLPLLRTKKPARANSARKNIFLPRAI
jgi:propanol-preferring alcohol dehydrogenase